MVGALPAGTTREKVMSSDHEAVTDGQLEWIRNEAEKKGVNREMFQDGGIDEGIFDRALDEDRKSVV